MTFAAPSIARDYRLISSLDPALDQPERVSGQSDEAWQSTLDAWNDRIRVAREQNEWAPLLREGHSPTVFVCRQVPGDLWAMRTRVLAGMGVEEQMGHILRLALVAVENFAPDFKLKLSAHLDLDGKPTGWGKVASAEFVAQIAAIRDPAGVPIGQMVVNELGALVITRQMGAPPGK